MILFICSAIFFIAGIFLFIIRTRQTKVEKEKCYEFYKKEIIKLQTDISKLNKLQSDISELEKQKIFLEITIKDKKKEIEAECEEEKEKIKNYLDLYKENLNHGINNYTSLLEQKYIQKEEKYDKEINQLEKSKKEIEDKIQELKNTLSAGVQAQLREKEKEEKINFYKINLSKKEIQDIKSLLEIKENFNYPIAINKLIWSTYIQKQVTDMCNRIIGKNTTCCGIYKITNLKTQECYIGQSLNIAERWKTHCKCGCGINAPASNKLYKNMIDYGIWNFSFEVLEKNLQKNQLNEKERFWILMYQSNVYGLNSTQGNK